MASVQTFVLELVRNVCLPVCHLYLKQIKASGMKGVKIEVTDRQTDISYQLDKPY